MKFFFGVLARSLDNEELKLFCGYTGQSANETCAKLAPRPYMYVYIWYGTVYRYTTAAFKSNDGAHLLALAHVFPFFVVIPFGLVGSAIYLICQ